MLSHPLPGHRLHGLSPRDGEDSQALIVLLLQRCSSPGEHDMRPSVSMGDSNTFWASAQA